MREYRIRGSVEIVKASCLKQALLKLVDEDGELTAVELPETAQSQEQAARKSALKEEAARRGYQEAGRVRPRNMMPFLAK